MHPTKMGGSARSGARAAGSALQNTACPTQCQIPEKQRFAILIMDSQAKSHSTNYSSNLAYSSHDFRYPLTNSEIMNLFRGGEGVPVLDASHEQFSN